MFKLTGAGFRYKTADMIFCPNFLDFGGTMDHHPFVAKEMAPKLFRFRPKIGYPPSLAKKFPKTIQILTLKYHDVNSAVVGDCQCLSSLDSNTYNCMLKSVYIILYCFFISTCFRLFDACLNPPVFASFFRLFLRLFPPVCPTV